MLKGETILTGAPRTCGDCSKSVEMGIHHSAAGYYYGGFCDCGPYSRESGYYPSRESCQDAINNGTLSWRTQQ